MEATDTTRSERSSQCRSSLPLINVHSRLGIKFFTTAMRVWRGRGRARERDGPSESRDLVEERGNPNTDNAWMVAIPSEIKENLNDKIIDQGSTIDRPSDHDLYWLIYRLWQSASLRSVGAQSFTDGQ